MAQNTQKEVHGHLTIKYGVGSLFSTEASEKLQRSVSLAQSAVKGAAQVLMLLRAQQPSRVSPLTADTVGAVPDSILRYHFGLPCPPRSWQSDIATIVKNFLRIYVGLTTP